MRNPDWEPDYFDADDRFDDMLRESLNDITDREAERYEAWLERLRDI